MADIIDIMDHMPWVAAIATCEECNYVFPVTVPHSVKNYIICCPHCNKNGIPAQEAPNYAADNLPI